jgi:hypothetical protein
VHFERLNIDAGKYGRRCLDSGKLSGLLEELGKVMLTEREAKT